MQGVWSNGRGRPQLVGWLVQQLRGDLFRDQRTHVFAVIGANTVLVSVALALVRFA